MDELTADLLLTLSTVDAALAVGNVAHAKTLLAGKLYQYRSLLVDAMEVRYATPRTPRTPSSGAPRAGTRIEEA